MRYLNHYHCAECEISWESEWDAMCEDECEVCDKPYTPVASEELAGDYAQCQRCDRKWNEEDLHKIDELNERVDAGDPFPAGQCPDCGALCYLIEYHSGEGRCADPSCNNNCQCGSAERIQQGDTGVQGDTPTPPAPSPREWLYRVSETDGDGDDPYDFGVVRADTVEDALTKLGKRLAPDSGPCHFNVYLYQILGHNEDGFIRTDFRIEEYLDVRGADA